MRDVTSETTRFQPVGEKFVCIKVQRHDPAVTLEMFPSAKTGRNTSLEIDHRKPNR